MLIQNRGFNIGQYYIPPFELSAEETLLIQIPNGGISQSLEKEISEFFSGKKLHENITVFKPFKTVEHFFEPRLRRIFYSVRVGEYIKKYANRKNSIAENIYKEESYINKKTAVNSLEGTPRKLLSLYTCLSHSNNIITDFVGISPNGAIRIFEVLKEYTGNTGAAILVDRYDEFERLCTKTVRVEH